MAGFAVTTEAVTECQTQVADIVNRLQLDGKDKDYVLRICEQMSGISGQIDIREVEGPL